MTTRRSSSRSLIPMKRFALAGLTALPLLLAGCATPFLKSTVEVPGRFASAAVSAEDPEAAWWEGFGDPVLTDLILRAARENRDIRIAAERVRAARAGEVASRSWLFPSVGLSASGVDRGTGYDSALKRAVPTAADFKSASAGVDVSWEIDLAGRLRAGASAAEAQTMAAEHGVRGVRLLVLTDVATNYFTLTGALRQLETVRAIAAAQDDTLRLVTARQRVGLATSFDVERAQTEASRAHAAIPPLETIAAVSRHRIAVLIGDQAVHAASVTPWTGEAVAPPARPGQPAALLQRRPDLLALQAQLDAANWRRKEAAAEWFPRLLVGALFGRFGMTLNGASLGSARFSNASGLLSMPVFNSGRTQAINDIAESGQSEALYRYEDAIVRALEDVENALVTLGDEGRRAEALKNASASAESALGRAQTLYDRGQIDLLPLLDAQRARLAARLGSNDSNTRVLLDSVQLYKALGGGWQAFEPPAASAPRSPNS